MGFLSFCSSVVSTVSNIASAAWEGAKSMASKAVGWMAEKSESFIGDIANIWHKVKPYIRPALKLAEHNWPWLKPAVIAFEKALDWAENFKDSELAKKLKTAIEWVIKASKHIKEKILNDTELEAAQARDDLFKEAEANLSADEKQGILFAELINKFIIVQTLIQRTFDENFIHDFDHYLRLRATQKLLALSEKFLVESQDIDSIGSDDLFLISIGEELLATNPTLSDSDLNRLNSLIYSRFNKELIPFIFEEMIVAWAKNLVDLERKWESENKVLSKDIVKLKTLENTLKLIGNLDIDDNEVLHQLRKSVPLLKSSQDALAKSKREMQNYVYAAEGFLEILEGNEFLEGKEYLLNQSSTVGAIIIDCAQNGKKWEALTEDEQELIIDFANIFKQHSIARANSINEVEVSV
jgi:hypothetical protein